MTGKHEGEKPNESASDQQSLSPEPVTGSTSALRSAPEPGTVFSPLDPLALAERPFELFGTDFCLVTAQKPNGLRNSLTAAWGTVGTYWNRPVATVLIRPHRYTREFLDEAGRFTLSFLPKRLEDALWFVGRVSGRAMPDKVEQAGLHPISLEGAPAFAEARLALSCRTLYAAPLERAAFLDGQVIDERYSGGDFSIQYVGMVEKAWVAKGDAPA